MRPLNIFGTLGPACQDEVTLESIFQAGATGMRLNLSHGSLASHADWIERTKKAADKCGLVPELLIDMQGPELRVSRSVSPRILTEGEVEDIRELGFPDCLVKAVQPGSDILVDDGRLLLKMKSNHQAQVVRGGTLLPAKSIAVSGLDLQLPALTEEDRVNLAVAAEYGITGIMQPFVRSPEDLARVRQVMNENGLEKARLYAKIESAQGVEMLETLFPHCDEIIIARGDLADSVGLVQVARVQYYIEETCRKHHKPYMVVTQMLDSMIQNPVPTRAEISDIYHAVHGGAASIMLTGETASGKYPVQAMEYFVQTARTAQ